MSTPHTIQTAIEFIIIAALIYGLFNESKIAAFEQKIINKLKRK